MFITGNAFKWKQGSKTPGLPTGSSEVTWQGWVLLTACSMSKEDTGKQEEERRREGKSWQKQGERRGGKKQGEKEKGHRDVKQDPSPDYF